jgi:hypothetical protein
VGTAANAAATLVGNSTLCPGQTAQIQAVSGQGTYAWFRNGQLISGATSNVLSVTSAGSYHAEVVSTTGCSAVGQPISINASNLVPPTVQNVGASALCPGVQTTLQASGIYSSLLWSTGAVTSSVQVNTPGLYWATATDVLGCVVGSDTLTVTAAAPAVAAVSLNGPQAFCDGLSTTLDAGAGMATYQWYWNGLPLAGEVSSTLATSNAGSYRVGTTSSDGCSALSVPQTLVVYALPAVPQIVFSTAANWLLSSAPSGNQWFLNGTAISGADSTYWQPTQNGVYTVQVTNSNGCTSVSSPYNFVNLGMDESGSTSVRLMPNPASEVAVVHVGDGLAGARMYAVDALGRRLWEAEVQEGMRTLDVPVATWARGIYRIVVEAAHGQEVLPLVVQ